MRRRSRPATARPRIACCTACRAGRPRPTTPAARPATRWPSRSPRPWRPRVIVVDRAVGQSHFRCDLAVRREGETVYRLAILLDNDSYYDQSDLLERDLMRPKLLRDFGWKVAFVLAKDWYRRPRRGAGAPGAPAGRRRGSGGRRRGGEALINSGTHEPAAHDKWQAMIDYRLDQWESDPSQLDDDEMPSASRDTIRLAIRVAKQLRDNGSPAPTRIVPDAHGGIVFEREAGSVFESIRISAGGSAEYCGFEDCRMVQRAPLIMMDPCGNTGSRSRRAWKPMTRATPSCPT